MMVYRTQTTHVLEDLTHRTEGRPCEKEVRWAQGSYVSVNLWTNKDWIWNTITWWSVAVFGIVEL